MSAFHGSINRGNLPQQIAGPRMDNQNQSSIADVARPCKSDARAAGLREKIRNIYAIAAELETMFPGRKFTPDGNMVGERQLQRSNTELNYSLSARQE